MVKKHLQYPLNCLLVFSFSITPVDKDVLQVPSHSFKVFKDLVHHFLECGQDIGQAKRYYRVFKQTFFRVECGFPFLTFCNMDQVITVFQVQFGKPLATASTVEKVVNPRKRVSIQGSKAVEYCYGPMYMGQEQKMK